jgi:hypothetical protein
VTAYCSLPRLCKPPAWPKRYHHGHTNSVSGRLKPAADRQGREVLSLVDVLMQRNQRG